MDEQEPDQQTVGSDDAAETKTVADNDELKSNDSHESNESNDDNDEDNDEEVVNDVDTEEAAAVPEAGAPDSADDEQKRYDDLKIIYNGRDVLDFCSNIGNQSWNVQYTYLPENNFPMYLANRSQYHRLGASWNTKEYTLSTCRKCLFQYPVSCQVMSGNAGAVGPLEINAPNAPAGSGNANPNPPMTNPYASSAAQHVTSSPKSSFNFNFNSSNNGSSNGSNMMSGGQQSNMYLPNQFNNNMPQNPNVNMNTFKPNNSALFNGNSNSNNNVQMNSFNSNMNNAKYLLNMYRQNYKNAGVNCGSGMNTMNSANKTPYKMYSHF